MSIRAGEVIVMAPSGVQKERMQPQHMFVVDKQGTVLHTGEADPNGTPLKLSECAPLFLAAYELRNAGAVLHSHSMDAMLATLLPGTQAVHKSAATGGEFSEFQVTCLEMIKGIKG